MKTQPQVALATAIHARNAFIALGIICLAGPLLFWIQVSEIIVSAMTIGCIGLSLVLAVSALLCHQAVVFHKTDLSSLSREARRLALDVLDRTIRLRFQIAAGAPISYLLGVAAVDARPGVAAAVMGFVAAGLLAVIVSMHGEMVQQDIRFRRQGGLVA